MIIRIIDTNVEFEYLFLYRIGRSSLSRKPFSEMGSHLNSETFARPGGQAAQAFDIRTR